MEQPPDRSLVPVACAAGGVALVAQAVLVRELMVSFYGTELALAAVLCCWLAFAPLGALAAAAVLRRARPGLSLVYPALAVLAVALPAELVVARLVRPILGAQVGEFLPPGSMAAAAALAAVAAAVPVGFLFTAAARSEAQRFTRRARGIACIYVAEAAGSAAAGALLSFYLLGRLPPTALAFAAAVVLLAVAALRAGGASGWLCLVAAGLMVLLLCWSGARQSPALFFGPVALIGAAAYAVRLTAGPWRRADLASAGACAALGLLLAAAHLGWGNTLAQATGNARWRTFSTFRLIASRSTRYQHAEVGEREGDYVLVQNGRRTAQFPDPAAARQRAALLLTQHPGPRDVLVIGGGLEGLCQEMLASPLRSLDYVQPDPQVIRLLLDHLPAELAERLRDRRFGAYACDGRRFVQEAAGDPSALSASYLALAGGEVVPRRPAGAYDLIVVNVGDPTSASASRFYTVEFCRELKRILRPGGAVAFCGISAGENLVKGGVILDYTACIYRTVRSAFPEVIVRSGGEFCYFAAGRAGVVSADPRVLADRFDALGLKPDVLKHGFQRVEFQPERTRHVALLLDEAAGRAHVNTDERPVAFMLFLALESHFTGRAVRQGSGGRPGAGISAVLDWLRPGPPRSVWLALFMLVLPAALARVSLGQRRAVPWACGVSVFTTGIFGLATQMLVVYGYQTAFGYVYRDIGAIVGLFMLGLALAASLSSRVAGRSGRLLLAAEAAQAVLLVALPALAGLLAVSPYAFMLLALAAGFLTGAEFPLAAGLSLGSGRSTAAVAGVLSAADGLGALVGGACAGLVLVPALGLAQTTALLALAKCASLVGLALALLHRADEPVHEPAA